MLTPVVYCKFDVGILMLNFVKDDGTWLWLDPNSNEPVWQFADYRDAPALERAVTARRGSITDHDYQLAIDTIRFGSVQCSEHAWKQEQKRKRQEQRGPTIWNMLFGF